MSLSPDPPTYLIKVLFYTKTVASLRGSLLSLPVENDKTLFKTIIETLNERNPHVLTNWSTPYPKVVKWHPQCRPNPERNSEVGCQISQDPARNRETSVNVEDGRNLMQGGAYTKEGRLRSQIAGLHQQIIY